VHLDEAEPGPMGWPSVAPLQCPRCALRGAVRRRYGYLVIVSHACGGPWVLEGAEAVRAWTNPYRVVLYGEAGEAAVAAWGVDDSVKAEVGYVPAG
jgi:hypothetical protein